MDKLYYELEAELETETMWVCSVEGCGACCFEKDFSEHFGCARHGDTWVRVVRQFENGVMISEFKEVRAEL